MNSKLDIQKGMKDFIMIQFKKLKNFPITTVNS